MLNELIRDQFYLSPPDLSSCRLKFKDIMLNGVLIREYEYTCYIYFLDSSKIINIPSNYLVLFRNIDTSCGEKILYQNIDTLSKLDLFIFGFMKFLKLLEIRSQDSVKLIISLCELGTTEFREFMRDLGVNLSSWTFMISGKMLEL